MFFNVIKSEEWCSCKRWWPANVNLVIYNQAFCPPSSSSDPTKYFGCELGAQTQFDVKNDRYIVNGSHEANKLQDMLDGFIKKFVLCPECENPETDLVSAFEIFVKLMITVESSCHVSERARHI